MYWIYRAVFWLITFPIAVLPLGWGRALGALGGGLIFKHWEKRRRIAMHNLRMTRMHGTISLPEPDEALGLKSFENMGKSVIEMVKAYHGLDRGLMESVKIIGGEHYEAARQKGKGVIFITAHCGNWELMAARFPTVYNTRFAVVARAQNDPNLDKLVERMRQRTGNIVIYKDGAVKNILKALKQEMGVGILIDQATLANEGCIVKFLGREALTTRLPALIARKTGTPVLPIFSHREPDGTNAIVVYPEIELCDENDKEKAVVQDMRTMTGCVEAEIERYPEQWLWGHRRWKRAAETLEDSHGLNTND